MCGGCSLSESEESLSVGEDLRGHDHARLSSEPKQQCARHTFGERSTPRPAEQPFVVRKADAFQV